MNKLVHALPLLVLLACLCDTAPAQVVNGGFETGSLTPWTRGYEDQAAVVQSSNFSPGPLAAPGGTRFVALSNGPGQQGGFFSSYNIDGNGTTDYDLTTLTQTVTFTSTVSPARLVFAWNFPTSEQDQPGQFDDLFDVLTTIGGDTSRVFSGSSCKNDGSSYSPFPNVPCFGSSVLNWEIENASPISNTELRYGVGQWQNACVEIPGTVIGTNTVTLQFRIADQGDSQYDSALLLDDIAIRDSCNTATTTLEQITASTGGFVEVKGGGLVFAPVDNGPALSTNNTGAAIAFASSGNYTSDNPNGLQQVFIHDGSYSRVTGLTIASGGGVQGISLSGPTVGSLHGRYLAIAARLNGTASQQIYRWDRQASTLTQVTNTTGCSNMNPSISSNGNRIAWETTCSAYTSQGATKKVVYSNLSGGVWSTPVNFMSAGTPAATCTGSEPRLWRGDTGNYIALVSNCRLTGNPTPVTGEIYRYRIDNNSWQRVTTATSASTVNFSPSIDAATGTSAGRYIYFISDGNYFNVFGDVAPEIYRYDVNSSTLRQLTITQTGNGYIGVRQAADGGGQYFAYEYVNGSTGQFEVGTGRYTGTLPPTLKLGASMEMSLGVDVGIDSGNVPRVVFLSPSDLMSPSQNADGNTEIYSARTP
jgi:hypothetical protein